MKRLPLLSTVLTLVFVSACAPKPTKSGDEIQKIEDKWKARIGYSTKSDFVEEYGNPEWCRMSDGQEETCRFYKKLKKRYIGDGRDAKEVQAYDQVIAEFGVDGKLKSFKADAQR